MREQQTFDLASRVTLHIVRFSLRLTRTVAVAVFLALSLAGEFAVEKVRVSIALDTRYHTFNQSDVSPLFLCLAVEQSLRFESRSLTSTRVAMK